MCAVRGGNVFKTCCVIASPPVSFTSAQPLLILTETAFVPLVSETKRKADDISDSLRSSTREGT